MTGRLEGRVALISGAARGQGAAEAQAFAAEGAKVVLGDVLHDEAQELARSLGDDAVAVRLDVTDPDSWAAAVQATTAAFGSLDVLVNNAGIMRVGSIEDQDLADYHAVIAVNQTGCFLGMRAAVPAMRAAGGGSIINTCSISGFQGTAGLAAYSASKWAVRGLTRTAAIELASARIRVNAIAPGTIDTPMVSSPEFDEVDKDAYFAGQPVPRMGRPEEVAAMAVFLASDAAAFCTGAEYVVDGGSLAGPKIAGVDDHGG